jgi:hypothetical protein
METPLQRAMAAGTKTVESAPISFLSSNAEKEA